MPDLVDMARGFLAQLFPPALSAGLGFLSLWCRNGGTRFVPAAEVQGAAELAVALDAEGKDVHVGVALLGVVPSSGRGTVEQVAALGGFWADIDVRGPTHPEETYPPDYAEAGRVLEEIPMQPTVVVDSGYGLHVWWLFDRLLRVDEGSRSHAIERSRAWGSLVKAAGARRGWTVDTVSDLARVLRLPGTTNRKLKGETRPVVVLLDDGPRYPPDFEIPGFAPPRASTRPSAPMSADVPPTAGTPLDVEEAARRLGRLARPDLGAAARLVLDGQVFAPHGARETTLRDLCGALARIAPWNDPDELAVIFEASLEALVREHPDQHPETVDELVRDVADKIRRAQEKLRPEVAKDAALLVHLRGLACKKVRKDFPPPGGGAEDAGSRPAEGGDDPTGGAYSDEELASFADSSGCDPEEFQRRWVIQKGKQFYVFVNGDYRRSKTKEELENCLEEMLFPAARWIQFTTLRQDGSQKRRTVSDILRGVTTVADRVVVDMTIERSRYDAETRTFHEMICPRRPVRPAFDDRIDRWLRLLGGAPAEKLLDWIATVTMLDRQTSCLFISGEPGSGKSLLTHGLARIWTEGGPVELHRIVESFNADLLYCPLVWADEEVPEPRDGTTITGHIRSSLGSSVRTLARKFQDNSTIKGAFRIMLCGNTDEMLITGDTVLGTMSLEAVASRILHIEVGKEPVHYLKSLGGYAATADWVNGDRIAAHALWLREHRQVVPGARFLVEGFETSMHRKLVMQGRIQGKVLEWLVRFLNSPIPAVLKPASPHAKPLVVLGDGIFLVNTQALVDHWKDKIRDLGPPSTTLVGKALTGLCFGATKKHDGVKYHVVNLQQVFDWAETNQIGNLEQMRTHLEKGFTDKSRQPETRPRVETKGQVIPMKERE